jgi:hypothetical protein
VIKKTILLEPFLTEGGVKSGGWASKDENGYSK